METDRPIIVILAVLVPMSIPVRGQPARSAVALLDLSNSCGTRFGGEDETEEKRDTIPKPSA
jgi:hypothetical protein